MKLKFERFKNGLDLFMYRKLNDLLGDIENNFKESTSNMFKAQTDASKALNDSSEAIKKSDNAQKQVDTLVVQAGDSSPQVLQALVDEKGTTFSTLKAHFDDKGKRIDTKADFKEIVRGNDFNLIKNADFEKLPNIYNRNESVNRFTPKITSPQRKDKYSLKIEAVGYETSLETNKDFAFMLSDKMMPGEKMRVSFYAYPLVSNKTISMRMAYNSSQPINLGPANQWNEITFIVDLTTMTQGSDYFYIDLKSSFTFYMSEPMWETVKETTIQYKNPISLSRVDQKLNENPMSVKNSKGAIDRMLAVGQTYWDNVSKFVYGNRYTAYDIDLTLVDGKNEIDCSSFANLLVKGIPYDKTRYAGNQTNIPSNLFFQNIDPYKWRYANTMAKYAYENGYAFKPNADLSNIEPGDILFFSWRTFSGAVHDNAFMNIDHVAAFLHKKNDTYWSTLQFDNGISTVYYDATNDYMSQCVLVARFPFANVESMYPDENLLLDGDTSKSAVNTTTVGAYKLSKNLQKGRYYTLFVDGQVVTPNCYFVVQVNNKTIYSDSGRQLPYKGVTAFRFPYLLDDVTDTITISIGAPSGIDTNRNGNINWCSLYEGLARNKTVYNRASNVSPTKKLPLEAGLANDLDTNMAAFFEYSFEGNKIFANFALPFKTLRTGDLIVGKMGSDAPKSTQRLPVNLIGANSEAINAVLYFKANGDVTISLYSTIVQWRYAAANGFISRW